MYQCIAQLYGLRLTSGILLPFSFLSVNILQYDSGHVLALQTIGHVGVAISLIALVITVLTFSCLR